MNLWARDTAPDTDGDGIDDDIDLDDDNDGILDEDEEDCEAEVAYFTSAPDALFGSGLDETTEMKQQIIMLTRIY